MNYREKPLSLLQLNNLIIQYIKLIFRFDEHGFAAVLFLFILPFNYY